MTALYLVRSYPQIGDYAKAGPFATRESALAAAKKLSVKKRKEIVVYDILGAEDGRYTPRTDDYLSATDPIQAGELYSLLDGRDDAVYHLSDIPGDPLNWRLAVYDMAWGSSRPSLRVALHCKLPEWPHARRVDS